MPLDNPTRLPDSVQEIADVIGREDALDFVRQLPQSGSRKWRRCVYIPRSIGFEHPLIDMLGYDNAKKIVRAFGGEILQPSSCTQMERAHRNRSIVELMDEGVPADELADIYELSTYRIREIARFERERQKKEQAA